WPLGTHSLNAHRLKKSSSGLTVEPRVGGHILEECADREIRPWATITAWVPGKRVAFSWYVGLPETEATELDILFETADGGTRIELTHAGFEALGKDAQSTRDGYNQGWVVVLTEIFAVHCKMIASHAA
ncbi:MAG: SRPBCC domain-containing protein, partial [Boseongicola sp.]